nr:keratinocyte proline-rich protein [Taeniopygia guttata]
MHRQLLSTKSAGMWQREWDFPWDPPAATRIQHPRSEEGSFIQKFIHASTSGALPNTPRPCWLPWGPGFCLGRRKVLLTLLQTMAASPRGPAWTLRGLCQVLELTWSTPVLIPAPLCVLGLLGAVPSQPLSVSWGCSGLSARPQPLSDPSPSPCPRDARGCPIPAPLQGCPIPAPLHVPGMLGALCPTPAPLCPGSLPDPSPSPCPRDARGSLPDPSPSPCPGDARGSLSHPSPSPTPAPLRPGSLPHPHPTPGALRAIPPFKPQGTGQGTRVGGWFWSGIGVPQEAPGVLWVLPVTARLHLPGHARVTPDALEVPCSNFNFIVSQSFSGSS